MFSDVAPVEAAYIEPFGGRDGFYRDYRIQEQIDFGWFTQAHSNTGYVFDTAQYFNTVLHLRQRRY